MKPGTFFPYRVGTNISLTVASVAEGVTNHGGSVIDGYSMSPDRLSFTCDLDIDWDGAADLVDGDPRAELEPALRLRSVQSRRREIRPVPAPGDQPAAVDVVLNRSDWVGSVGIEAVLVRRATAIPIPGLAGDRGAVVSWSDEIRVHFDEPPTSLPGDHLEVRWVHFSDRSELAQWNGHLFSLTSDTPPVILLNLDVPEAFSVLDSRGTTGRKARIRDVIFHQIAHQTWTSLIANAVDNLGEFAEHDSGVDDQLAMLEDYEERIVRDWAPVLYPERDPEEALEEILEAARSRRVDDLFIRRIPHAIQQRLRTFGGFEGLVQEAGLFGTSE